MFDKEHVVLFSLSNFYFETFIILLSFDMSFIISEYNFEEEKKIFSSRDIKESDGIEYKELKKGEG